MKKIFALALANLAAELLLTLWSALNAGFFHRLIDNPTEVDLWNVFIGQIINRGRFTAARHTDNSKDFNVFTFHWRYYTIDLLL